MTPYIITIAVGICAGVLGIFALYKAFTAPPKKTTNPTPTLFDDLEKRYKQTGNKAYKAAAVAIIVDYKRVLCYTINSSCKMLRGNFFCANCSNKPKSICPKCPDFCPPEAVLLSE